MNPDTDQQNLILDNLQRKANLKQRVFDNTTNVFNDLKETLHEMLTEIDDLLDQKIEKGVRIEYRDRGKFEAQAHVAEDILIFTLQTEVYQFPDGHAIWSNRYVGADRNNSYCGIINIYNFLADSFRYNRSDDEGYLIGRIFVNRESMFFVEGKDQRRFRVDSFGETPMNKKALECILETAINYALRFDLLVPPYEFVKKVSVTPFNQKMESAKLQTGKRLGYTFDTDDI